MHVIHSGQLLGVELESHATNITTYVELQIVNIRLLIRKILTCISSTISSVDVRTSVIVQLLTPDRTHLERILWNKLI